MKIRLNGEPREVDAVTTIGQLVDGACRDRGRIAVERNADIVPRARYDSSPVAEGDVIEIVTLVGGG